MEVLRNHHMYVLFNCISAVSGGALSYLRNITPLLSRLFKNSSEEALVMFLAYEEQAPLLEGVDGVQVCWIHGDRLSAYRRIFWERRNLARIAREQRADVLFTPYQISPRVPGIRQVLMLRNLEPFLFDQYRYSPKTWVRNYLLRRLSVSSLRRADRVIAVSGFAHEQLKRIFGSDSTRTKTIYHGEPDIDSNADDTGDLDTLKGIGIGSNYILTCGSFLPYRRCEDVIAAFNRCGESLPAGTQLVIAGEGNDRRYGELICRMIADSPYSNLILALGHVHWNTMTALYRRCLMCVIASEIEACPNIAIEGMTAGCAIVSSDRPPLPEMFEEGAFFYTARDVDALSRSIRELAQNDHLRNSLKKKALERSTFFSWEKCAHDTYAALTDWQDEEG